VDDQAEERRVAGRLGRFYSPLISLDGILGLLSGEGVDPGRMTAESVYTRGLDCQNLGGFPQLQRTAEVVASLSPPGPGDLILDLGCGLGGPGRFLAERFACRVLGLDLVPERIEVARDLTKRTGLEDRVDHRVGDACALPVEAASCAQVWMLDASIHVRDKPRLFGEIARVLRPGGVLVLHDQVGPLPRAMRVVTRRAPYHAPSLTSLLRRVEDAGLRLLLWQDTTPHILSYFQDLERRRPSDVAPVDRSRRAFSSLVDAYLETLRGREGRTGLLLARRERAA
jgi:SAM-dependent methyltransferase